MSQDGRDASEDVVAFLGEFHGLGRDKYAPCLCRRRGLEAVVYLFMVAARLVSMILGEPQILGQMCAAYEAAAACRTAGHLLSRAFNQAMKVGMKVRKETALAAKRCPKLFCSRSGAQDLIQRIRAHGGAGVANAVGNGLAASWLPAVRIPKRLIWCHASAAEPPNSSACQITSLMRTWSSFVPEHLGSC